MYLKKLCAGAACAICLPLQAAQVYIDFSFEIVQSVDPTILVGQIFTGQLSYNSDGGTVDSSSLMSFGVYEAELNPSLNGSIYIDQFATVFDLTGIEVLNGSSSGEDIIDFKSTFMTVPGRSSTQISFEFVDEDGLMFTNKSLPTGLSFDDIEPRNNTFFSNSDVRISGNGSAIGVLTSLNTSAVPIPAAAWLFGSALVGMMGFQFKKSI